MIKLRQVFVFMVCRPCDKGQAWPSVYTDRKLAEAAFGRVSQVTEVWLKEWPTLEGSVGYNLKASP
jgi:hypothetical protein